MAFCHVTHVQVRLLHLPTARLAELKSQATAELAQEKEWEESHAAAHAAAAAGGNDNAACCGCAWHGPALRDVQWVSSNDVLCARLMQASAWVCAISQGQGVASCLRPPCRLDHS